MSTFFHQLTDHPFTEVVGWTLVHFLWQGLAIAVVVAILLICLRRASAATRYLLACGGLSLMAIAPLVTASWLAATMQQVREPQTANSNLSLDDSFVARRSQAEVAKALSAPMTNLPPSNTPPVAAPQDAEATTPSAARISWQETLRNSFPYFVVFWTVGVLLLSIRLLGGLWRVQQWRRSGIAIKATELQEMAARLAAVLGLKRKFELLESAQTVVPAVIGWLKPAVIVPTSLISGLTPAELESLLAHELAHIRRHDYLINLLQTVIETVLFYHPAVWWLSRVIRCERENCCDDLAVAACGSRVVFAKALAKMEELRCGGPGLALSARGGSLLGRVQRLLAPTVTNRTEVWWPAGAASLLSVAVFAIGLSLAAMTDATNSNNALASTADRSDADDRYNTHQPEVKVVDTVTRQTHDVLSGVWLAHGHAKARLDMKYSNVFQYTFIPARIAKELGATEIGEIDFGDDAPKKEPMRQMIFTPSAQLIPQPPDDSKRIALQLSLIRLEDQIKVLTEKIFGLELSLSKDLLILASEHAKVKALEKEISLHRAQLEKYENQKAEIVDALNSAEEKWKANDAVQGQSADDKASRPTAQMDSANERVYVDDLDGSAGDKKIVPYDNDAIWIPDHLAFYGVNQKRQTKFRVVRIEQVNLGLGPRFGPVNALVLDDANTSLGVLGSNWARIPRGPEGETLVHSAVDGFWFMKLPREDQPARPSEQADGSAKVNVEKVLSTYTYDLSRRESSGWVEINGTSLPVDDGPEAEGVKVYLTLMFDLVAVDAKSGNVLWHRNWSKLDPTWKTVSIVEFKDGADSKLGVKLSAQAWNAKEMDHLYLDLKTGTELQPPATASLPLRVVEHDNGVNKRIELKALTEGRSAKELWQKWTSVRQVTGGPGVSVTDSETLVSAGENARWIGHAVDADEMVFSLPEGSGIRAEFFGDKVEIIENGNQTSVVVTNGRVNLIDQGGVIRAWASADGGAEQTIADVSFQQQEFVLRLKAKRLVDDPKFMPNMQCATYPETGAAKDEEQSPHGAVRYQIQEDVAKREFRLRMLWRYDVDRIKQEAETTDQDTPSSTTLQSSTWLQQASAPLAVPADEDSDFVAKARKLGDWLEFGKDVRFDSRGYMQLAGEFIALDERLRIEALRSMANAKLEGQTIALCRMLFEAKAGAEFRRPGLGAPHLVGMTTETKDWPLEPITLVGEVPLMIVHGYSLSGQPEPAINYLEYCLANCAWTKRTFAEIEKGLAAAEQVIRQPAFWAGSIDQSEWREWADLRLQLGPSLVMEVMQQSWVNIDTARYSVLDLGTWEVKEAVEKVKASGYSPDLPVTLIISDNAKMEWIEPLVKQLAEAGYRNQEHIWWQQSHEPIQKPELQKHLIAVSTPVGNLEEDWGPADAKTGLRLRLTLKEKSTLAGKPVLAKLELENSGDKIAEYDPQVFTPFRVVQVVDGQGKSALFIGPTPQTFGSPLKLAPGDVATLWEEVDISELYLLDSGDYEVSVSLNDRDQQLVLKSGSARLKIEEGKLPHNLQFLKQLREISPAAWSVSTGYGAIYLSHSPTNLKKDVTTIQLWFTEKPLPADYKLGEGVAQQQITTIGPTELGFLHLAAPARATELWPEHLQKTKIAAARTFNLKANPDSEKKENSLPDTTRQDQTNNLPWRATGQVTDRDGKPLAGVSVQAHCGFGTLFRTGSAVTDAEGRYDLKFGPGISSSNRQLVQAATISVFLEGFTEKNMHRHGDKVAALDKPAGEIGWGKAEADLFLPDRPMEINFVMVPAARLTGTVLDQNGNKAVGYRVSLTGKDLPPSSSVIAQVLTNDKGEFEITRIPTGYQFQLLVESPKTDSQGRAWASPPITFRHGADDSGPHVDYLLEGKVVDFSFQQFFAVLKGGGVHWKTALADMAEKQFEAKWDGLSNDSQVSAGMATIELGMSKR